MSKVLNIHSTYADVPLESGWIVPTAMRHKDEPYKFVNSIIPLLSQYE